MLITLLHRRARQKRAFDCSPRRLLAERTELRLYRSIDMTGLKSKPRAQLQLEEANADLTSLAESLGAVPTLR
jgi:hypothetical protein